MKKVFLFIALILVAAAIFARDEHPFSLGLIEGLSWEKRWAHSEGPSASSPSASGSESQTATANAIIFGFFADFTYWEASISVLSQLGKYKVTDDIQIPGQYSQKSDFELDTKLFNVNFRALGKWPVKFGDVTLFPLLGPEYSYNVYVNRNPQDGYTMSDDDVSELSNWFVDFGAGADFALGNRYYLRLEGVQGINMNPLNHGVKKRFTGSYSDSASRFSLNLGLGYRL